MIKQWFLNKKKQLRLMFSRLVLKVYAKGIPFLRKLKIYSINDIQEKTRGPNSVGVPYADGIIMDIKESGWKDGKVSVLFCHPNRGFIIKTVEIDMLVAGLVDFGSPRHSQRAWDRLLKDDSGLGAVAYGIQEIGTFSYNNAESTRLSQEEFNKLRDGIREEYKNYGKKTD